MKAMKKHTFPRDFLWGASTAAHQVEGDTHNQWSEWEKQHAGELARGAEKRLGSLPVWKAIRKQAEKPANYISGKGVDHYSRYRQDFDIAKKLNMNAFRFGLEWSRIEPEEGKWDEQVVGHYRKYIVALKRRGIEPVLTIWHWTLPVWFAAKGGFESRDNLRYFERYVAKIAEEFGGLLNYVIILNEPNVYASISYIAGEWPPQHHNPVLGFWVYRNLALAHQRAYHILRQANPALSLGIAIHMADIQPTKPESVLNQRAVAVGAYAWNWWFLDRIRDQLDFVGVNYYHTEYRNWRGKMSNSKEPVSDLGWYMEPKSLGRLLEAVWRRYHLPIIITENGVADREDAHRQWWLEQTMEALERALEHGVELKGYLHWSLLDNFEWAFGWWPNFGLVAVDRKTMRRTIRPSARWFAEYIKQHTA